MIYSFNHLKFMLVLLTIKNRLTEHYADDL